MKIGILTHQYINNYGAFLQAWALREAISELFPEDEVQIIDYVNIKHYNHQCRGVVSILLKIEKR